MFTNDGKLTQAAIDEAEGLQRVAEYNPKSPVYQELSKRGNIKDWEKFRTQKFSTPEPSNNIGVSKRNTTAEVHFYKNRVTGEVYLEKDFKVKYDTTGNPQMPVSEFLKNLPKDWEPPKP